MMERSALGLVRFLDARGGVVGGGVLLAGDLVVTCAHVVNSAVGRLPGTSQEPRDELVAMDFPLYHGRRTSGKTVAWSPLVGLGGGDVALLRLVEHIDGVPALSMVAQPASGWNNLATFGFPRGRPAGVWKTDVSYVGPMIGGWSQVTGRGPRGYTFQSGFSGCPLLDASDKVVGIVAQADEAPGVDTAAVIPAGILAATLAAAAGYAVLPLGDSRGASEVVADATAAFIGRTRRGPSGPVLLSCWDDFLALFGHPLSAADSYVGLAVRGFFDNGGRAAYMVKALPAEAATAAVRIPTLDPGQDLVVSARSVGAWANGFQVRVMEGTRQGTRLALIPPSDRRESDDDYDNLSPGANGPNPMLSRVQSAHVTLAWGDPTRSAAVPLTGTWCLAGGMDGGDSLLDHVGASGSGQGIQAIGTLSDVGLVCLPDLDHPKYPETERRAVRDALLHACEQARCVAILGWQPGHGGVNQVLAPTDRPSAAAFFPAISVPQAVEGDILAITPVGHVAGAIARHDFESGVHSTVSGVSIWGATATPGIHIDEADADLLLRRGVNPLRDTSSGLVVLPDAVTCAIDDDERRLVTMRTYFMIARAVSQGLAWTAFSPNSAETWNQVKSQVGDYLRRLWEEGALIGASPDEAFFVSCGRETMTDADVDNGRLVVGLGLALGGRHKPMSGGLALHIQPGSL